MVSVIKYKDLGGADHGWLKAKHHFSFASYYNPKRMGFGTIRVINDDIIKAKKGFDPHQHNDMEIITYVRSGAITHTDNQNNKKQSWQYSSCSPLVKILKGKILCNINFI